MSEPGEILHEYAAEPDELPPEIEAVIEEGRAHPELSRPRPKRFDLAEGDPVAVARRMKAEDISQAPATRRYLGPMCGQAKTDAELGREKLMADAILLERALAALRRRATTEVSVVTMIELNAIALLWRTQASG